MVTSPALRGAVPLEITANGNVVAEATVAVRSRVDGQIREVHVQEGQRVTRGQMLFTLDRAWRRRSWRSRKRSWHGTVPWPPAPAPTPPATPPAR
ncbi:biotin/lipoyl-binding protein [Pseudoroseomonas wenyumeiae]